MKTIFSNGAITLTAETKEESEQLLKIGLEAGEATPTKRKYTKQTDTTTVVKKKRKARAIQDCPVDGCDKQAKSLTLHMLMAHGIHKDGTVHEEVEFSGGRAPVTQPVVSMPDGSYKLRRVGGLLG